MCSERVSMAERHFAGCEAEGRCGAAGANAYEELSAGRVTPFYVNGGAAKRSLGSTCKACCAGMSRRNWGGNANKLRPLIGMEFFYFPKDQKRSEKRIIVGSEHSGREQR